jgi:DNA helicase II / ATP-dependent DNA helicase PcrA
VCEEGGNDSRYFNSDKERVQKTLHTSHPSGVTPRLLNFKSEQEEAPFIAHEIKKLVAYTGGMLNWGDFVVLRKYTLNRAIAV